MRRKKILVIDGNHKTQQLIENTAGFDTYDFEFVGDGESAKEVIFTFQPDLILIELLTPKLHGIELVKWIKSDVKNRQLGIIVMSYELMLQNYRASLEAGAHYFLPKPFKPSELFLLIEKYFAADLQIEPFTGEVYHDYTDESFYDPKIIQPTTYLKFWGTRGSISVSGEKYVRMGGNTSTLEIRDGENVVIIDSGTGVRPLGEKLLEEQKSDLNLLISHTHQDHVVGFPFFAPLYSEKTHLTVWSPIGFEKTTESLFNEMLAYSFFPVRLDQMRAEVSFRDLHDSHSYSFGNIEIETCYTYHPGATLGFKITVGEQKIGYITDNEFLVGFRGHPNEITIDHPLVENHLPLIEFLSDCSTVIHEAQYFPHEYEDRKGWGHSSVSNAVALFKLLNCDHWIVTHHDPRHTDELLMVKSELHRQIMTEAGVNCRLTYAYDGLVLPIKFT